MNVLWRAFDKDNSGYVDQDELQEIVFHLIVIFWEYATPKKKVPKRDQLQSVIDHICHNIMQEVDLDKNGQITRNEFDLFGKYIETQWQATKDKVEEHHKNNPAFQGKGSSFNLSDTFRGKRKQT